MSGENSILAISDSMTQPDGYDPYRHLFSAYIPSEKDWKTPISFFFFLILNICGKTFTLHFRKLKKQKIKKKKKIDFKIKG